MSIKERLFHYCAETYRVIDGDTTKVVLDLGFDIALGQASKYRTWRSVRIVGVDTPEVSRKVQREAGKAVKKVVELLLLKKAEEGGWLVKSVQVDDKYAKRFIGDIVWDEEDGSVGSLSQFLLEHRLATKYKGKKKKAWTAFTLKRITNKCKSLIDSGMFDLESAAEAEAA